MKKFILIAFAVLPIMAWAQTPNGQKGQGGQAPQGVQTAQDGQAPQGTSGSKGAQSAMGGAPQGGKGLEVKYEAFIYTDKDLADEIQRVNDRQDTVPNRRFGANLKESTLDAGKSIASGYLTSIIDLGANAIAALVTRKARLKEEWLNTVQAENTWSTSINTVKEVKDFYTIPSEGGALDPLGMHFNGIGCLRTSDDDKDTLFYISCHIDRDKLYRIVNHSKFELVLDTLILSPTHSNLPNTSLPIEFSFDQRRNFNLSINIKLSSSWFTDAIELHNDEQLGEFTINVRIDKNMVDKDGFFRYVRKQGEPSRYEIIGESFIVPRSYMGFRDHKGYHNIWGTGQYKISIELKESCDLTEDYMKNWNEDRKQRKKMQSKQEKSGGFFNNVWQTISSQKWDEATQQYIITFITSPMEAINKSLGIDEKDGPSKKNGSGDMQQKPN